MVANARLIGVGHGARWRSLAVVMVCIFAQPYEASCEVSSPDLAAPAGRAEPGPSPARSGKDGERPVIVARALAAKNPHRTLAFNDDQQTWPILSERAHRPPAKGSVLVTTPIGYVLDEHALQRHIAAEVPAAGWDVYVAQLPLTHAEDKQRPDEFLKERLSKAFEVIDACDIPLIIVTTGPLLGEAIESLRNINGPCEELVLAGVISIDGFEMEPIAPDVPPDDESFDPLAEIFRANIPLMDVTTSAQANARGQVSRRRLIAEHGVLYRQHVLYEIGPYATGLEDGLVQRMLGFMHSAIEPQ